MLSVVLLVGNPGLGQESAHDRSQTHARATNAESRNAAYLAQCAEDSGAGNRSSPNARPHNNSLALDREVRAILQKKNPDKSCVDCHHSGSSEGTTRFNDILDRNELISKGMIDIDHPENSKLHRALARNAMPLEGDPLSAVEKNKVLDWIKEGAAQARANNAIGFISDSDKELCILKRSQNNSDRRSPVHPVFFAVSSL